MHVGGTSIFGWPDEFKIEDDKLIKVSPINDNISKQEVILTKDVFIQCYNEWIKADKE